ncbi:MAG: AAA family ATPase [Sedimenticola sp.]
MFTCTCIYASIHPIRFFSRNIAKEMVAVKRKVGLTATTGMASTQLGPDAITVHHWAGILDGRHGPETLAELFDNDDNFVAARSRIQETECLIIDEISMLSKRTFELIEFVCRHVRQEDKAFGGLQVIHSV